VDGGLLPLGAGPVVGETTGREESGGLVQVAGGADGRDPGAAGRVLGLELGGVLSVVGQASGTSSGVT